MPNPILMLQSMLIAAGIAAAITGLAGWVVPRQRLAAGWSTAATVLGLGLGFAFGCLWLGFKPHWPPREDQDRLLEIVIPAVMIVELLAAWPRVPRWLIAALQLTIASVTARVLLDGSSYLQDLSGPGSREWSPAHAWLVLAGLALALVVSWISVAKLTARSPSVTPALALAGVIAVSGLTVMLSGYATGGQLGLPLAGGLTGVAFVSMVLPASSRPRPPVALGIVGLFSLIVIGRFFGQLTTVHASLLLAAPLLAWVPELPFLARLPAWSKGLIQLGVVATPALTILYLAQRNFAASYAGASME